MSYLVLARKWRPQGFDGVIGQRHVSQTLANAIKSGRLSHAYLFAGPRGVGKTSVARILAKALNCEQGPTAQPCNACPACTAITEGHCLDVLEIDGASNRGIDDIRQLRESVKYAPASVRTKVYIIDEVHMLTTDAFNALLKTLEEPPRHVCFVMATTEPLKVPATILSRCQRFEFGRVPSSVLQDHLTRIASSEGLAIDREALLVLARKAEGGVRDSLTLLDQVASTGEGPFTADLVREILGLSGGALCAEISAAILAREPQLALLRLQEAYHGGLNLQEVAEELVQHFRNLLLLSFGETLAEAVELTTDERERLVGQLREHGVTPADALRRLRILLDVTGRMRRSGHARVHLEVALAEMASLTRAVDLGEVLARLRGGQSLPAGPAPSPAAGPAAAPAAGQTASGHGSATALSGPRRSTASPAPVVPPAGGAETVAEPTGVVGPADGFDGSGDDPADPWYRVVARIRTAKPLLGSCLQGSRVLGLVDGRLRVVLDDVNGFKCGQVEQASSRRQVLSAIEAEYGRPLGFLVVRGDQAAGATAAAATPQLEGKETGPVVAAEAPAAAAAPERRAREGEAPAPAEAATGTARARPAPAQRPAGKATGAAGGKPAPPGKGRDRARRIAELMDGDIVGPAG